MPPIRSKQKCVDEAQKASDPPVFSFYKKKADPKSLPRILPSGQTEIRGYLTRTFTKTSNLFNLPNTTASTASRRPMTSKMAKKIAKENFDSIPSKSEAELRAELKAEEERKRELEALEKEVRKKEAAKIYNKKMAQEKGKEKLNAARGKQPEGQHSLSKFGFIMPKSKTQPEM